MEKWGGRVVVMKASSLTGVSALAAFWKPMSALKLPFEDGHPSLFVEDFPISGPLDFSRELRAFLFPSLFLPIHSYLN